MSRMHNPAHPGEVLQDWLEGVSVTEAARKLGVTRTALSRILHGHAGISPDMALRLADASGTSPESWLQMQMSYDLWQAEQRPRPAVEKLHTHA
ncbi:addiction module antidote protein, HigA family [Crenobacter cavernae]|uniref:Addiction module antidote protein, HigA family n=2 Tax=Crenobacter cavernae TaxID=2290923 RepID=A0ABY0FB80_9NEIS|nr:addiction module antidote protein, HigA family [Crenobacter cavernae]